jgi:hypothetical protein
MGKIVSLVEYRKKRCIEALMQDIGVPDYCSECGDDIETLLMEGILQEISTEIPHTHDPAMLEARLPPIAAPRKRPSARKR